MTIRKSNRLIGFAGLSVASVVALVAPGIAPTAASWVDAEWAFASLGTTAFDCGSDTGYETTARGRFLSGGVLGVDLDALASLNGVSATRTGSSSPVFSPAGATHVPGGPDRDTYLNPLDVTALGAIGIDLSGFTVGLPAGSAGATNQYAHVTDLGFSAGASGLVTDDGGIGVSPSTPDGDLPEPASVELSSLLPSAAGIADVALHIGAVAASSTLDWCSALESSVWGDGTVDGTDRSYGIAGLDLAVESPLIAGLVPTVQAAMAQVNSAVASEQGPTGSIAQSIRGTLTGAGGVLEGLDLGSSSGSVTLTAPDFTALSGLLSGPGAILSDGVVTLDLADPDGTIVVDLATLVGGPDQLNNLAPNTELIINSAVIDDITARVGSLVQGWIDDVNDALTAAIGGIQLHVDLTTRVGISSLGIDIISVETSLDSNLGDVIAPSGPPPVLSVSATALSLGLLGSVVAGILNTLGLGSLAGLVSGINSSATLPGELLAAITAVINDGFTSVVSTLVSDLATTASQVASGLGTALGPLPDVVSLMVNVQPDQPGAPSGVGYDPGSPPTISPEYVVTALRLGLLDGIVGAPVYVNLATASAGTNRLLP
ncbi:MAG: choice-of-anchor G family protein [Cryobacterium sp.]|nr:choice-of-anchor G family protein [Cryobacterium sp.]